MDVGENGRPRGPHMLVWFSINHPIVGVPNFDPYSHDARCFLLSCPVPFFGR